VPDGQVLHGAAARVANVHVANDEVDSFDVARGLAQALVFNGSKDVAGVGLAPCQYGTWAGGPVSQLTAVERVRNLGDDLAVTAPQREGVAVAGGGFLPCVWGGQARVENQGAAMAGSEKLGKGVMQPGG
jgi:hypothetical protein